MDNSNETYSINYDAKNNGHYSVNALEMHKKSKRYANFIGNLAEDSASLSINGEGSLTVNDAITKKTDIPTNIDTNWSITLNAPYCPENTVYDGVTYKYAFINSSNPTINWKNASEASAELASGKGIGYKSVKLTGSANTNANADLLVIRCSYPTYKGLVLGFSTGSGQERYLVSGATNTYASYVAYNIKADPNVTIKKEIVIFDVNGNPTYQDSIDAEPGDTVIFKVTIKNENGAKTRVKLTDVLPSGLTFVDMAKGDLVWQNKTNWTGFNDLQISKNGEIIRYIKCTVDEGVSGTKTNTATVEPVSGYKLDASDSPSKSDTATVNVLGYSYKIEKTSNKNSYQYGENPTFTITVTNTGSTTIKNVVVTEKIPKGLTYSSWGKETGWGKDEDNLIFTYSGMIPENGSKSFTVTCTIDKYSSSNVTKSGTDKTEEVTIAYRPLTNKAEITGITNKHDNISILTAESTTNKKAEKVIGILGYVYEITKIADKAQAEPGESITYTITVTNKRSTKIKNIQVTDVVFSEFESVTLSGTGWSLDSANVYKYSGELGLNESASFKLECKVGEALLKNEDTTIPNRATLTSVSNAIGTNGFGLETGIYDEVSTTIPGYDAVLSKYIKTGSEGTARASMTNDAKKNSPFIVNKGDTITYVIKVENTGSGNFTTLKLEDKIPKQLQVTSISSDWSRNGDIFTYIGNSGTLAGKTTEYLEIECKVVVSNMYLPNIVNEATYSEVLNKINTSVKDILHYGANKEEIRLDELDIAGTVWNDANKNGIMDSGEGKMSDVEVILHNVTNNNVYATTTTNNDGKYSFSNVIKGKDFVQAEGTTGYYSSTVYNEYYLEFKYNGITHQSTPAYANQSNLTGDGKYDTAKYPIDSNAAEKTSERNNFNNSLETISYNRGTANGGGKVTLKYEKNNNTSTLKEINGVDVNRTMSSYSFFDLVNETIDPLWLYTYNYSDKNDDITLPETEYLRYINLGLYDRGIKADLELTTTIDALTKTINGQRQISYRPEEFRKDEDGNYKRIENHQSNLYWTDYYYQVSNVYKDINEDIDGDGILATNKDIDGDGKLDILEDINGNGNLDNINLEDVRTYKTKKSDEPSIDSESDTNLEYTYKTKILNASTGVDAVVNEVVQYYDEKFEPALNTDGTAWGKNLKLDTNDDGILDKDYEYKTKIGYRIVRYKSNDITSSNYGINELKVSGKDPEVIDFGTVGAKITASGTSKYNTPSMNDYYIEEHGELSNGKYKKLFIQFDSDIVLQPGETLEIYTTYMVSKDGKNRLNLDKDHTYDDAESTKCRDYDVIAEINVYSTYFENTKVPSGTVDIDSNPGNLGIKEEKATKNPDGTYTYSLIQVADISDNTYYEDDTSRSNVHLGLTSNASGREIKGTVWDDGKMGAGADGEYKIGEAGVPGVKVILCEVVKVNDQYFEIPAVKVTKTNSSGEPIYDYITTTTDSNGNYELKGFFPGNYIVRFNYGHDSSNTDNWKYNGQDYKSTIYNLNNTNNFEDRNDNRKEIGPSKSQEYPNLTGESYTVETETRHSDARDDEKRRLEVMQYSVEMYNEKAEILKGKESSDKEELISNTRMFADTATFIAKNENISTVKTGQDADVLICLGQDSNGTSFWYESSEEKAADDINKLLNEGAIRHSATKGNWITWADAADKTTYLRNYVIENVDFGLVLRPENKIELKKYIKQITLESSAGDTIVDLHYDVYDSSTGNLLVDGDILDPILNEEISKGFENVQALNNTNTHQGFRYLNVDEELLQGAKIGIKYGFIAINNSDKDYIGSKLYGTASEIQSTTTPLTTEGVNTAILNAIVDSTLDKKHENNYYGNYLGNWYYKGGTPGPNDVEATIKIDNILDYVDNSLVFSSVDNDGKWGTILADELNTKGYLKKDVYILDGSTPPIKIIADCNNVEFQTENKNNLAITIDYVSSPMFKHLLTEDNGNAENRAETELYVSTFLSAENESDDMVYENIAEIIKFTTLTGRRTISASDISDRGLTSTKAQTVGNAKVNLVGYINSDTIGGTLSEPDTSITEKVMLTPPTGADWIDTYVLTRVIIYVVGSIVVIVLGILFIPKLVTKIKNRKFIK